MREQKEIICKDGIYYCPVCGSKKITINTSTALNKSEDANTGKYIDILKNKPYRMSNREKPPHMTEHQQRVWDVGIMSAGNVVGLAKH